MYFVIIMAFALVLSDSLPPETCNIFRSLAPNSPIPYWGTLAMAAGQIAMVGAYSAFTRTKTLRLLNGTQQGHDNATDEYGWWQQILLYVLSGFLILTLICTPWVLIVRNDWGLGRIPLVGDLVILAPLFLSLTVIWIVNYSVEVRLRVEALTDGHAHSTGELAAIEESRPPTAASAALQASTRRASLSRLGLGEYLADKFRHQVLILAAPMCIIVFAKHIITNYGPRWLALPPQPVLRDIILHSALGTVSVIVLTISPWLLRYIWATEPLPPGPLRDRFVRMCRRIGLRYREILIWHTHGSTVNAAVMGFIPPLRYILVSDALLETMDDDEIEAVFGHEAGHVQHWHLPFFGAFAVVSMYVAGGVMVLLYWLGDRYPNLSIDDSMQQLAALAALLLMWLFGFAWLSRKFERQADLYGVRSITPDIERCLVACPIHGEARSAGICTTAANIFGRTLSRIADLNGIPREAPSWRHGSIESRCHLIETFVGDRESLRRFDRKLVAIKAGLLVAVIIGSIAAVLIYYEPVMHALQSKRPLPGGLQIR